MTTQREPDTSAEARFADDVRMRMQVVTIKPGEPFLHVYDRCVAAALADAAGQAAPVPPPVEGLETTEAERASWAGNLPNIPLDLEELALGRLARDFIRIETDAKVFRDFLKVADDRAEGLAKEVERLQRQIESFEADADYHRAQRETIKRHEDQIRDLKVMVSAAETKLAVYEAPIGEVKCGHIADDCVCDDANATAEFQPEKPSMYSVVIYLVDKAFGGPEEGGWWYEYGHMCDAPHQLDAPGLEPMDLVPKFFTFEKRFEALTWRDKVNAALEAGENKGRPRIDQSNSEGRYVAIINDGMPPAHFPKEVPHYE